MNHTIYLVYIFSGSYIVQRKQRLANKISVVPAVKLDLFIESATIQLLDISFCVQYILDDRTYDVLDGERNESSFQTMF